MDQVRTEFEKGNLHLDHEDACLVWLVHFLALEDYKLRAMIRLKRNTSGKYEGMAFPDFMIDLGSNLVVVDVKNETWNKKGIEQVERYIAKLHATKGILVSFTDRFQFFSDNETVVNSNSQVVQKRIAKNVISPKMDAYCVFLRKKFE